MGLLQFLCALSGLYQWASPPVATVTRFSLTFHTLREGHGYGGPATHNPELWKCIAKNRRESASSYTTRMSRAPSGPTFAASDVPRSHLGAPMAAVRVE